MPTIVERLRRLPRHPQHTERIEAERGEHLARDEQPDRHHRAETREQQDGRSDVDRGRDAANRVPPGHAWKAAEGGMVPVAAATISSSAPAMTTWIVVAAKGCRSPSRAGCWPALDGEQSAGEQRHRDETGFP